MSDPAVVRSLRELDALVAEKVMGLDVRASDCDGDDGCDGYFPGRSPEHGGPPAYSTDIAAAWEVVEKLHDRGAVLRLDAGPGGSTLAAFEIVGHPGSCGSSGTTAPLAIVLAALLAVGVEVELRLEQPTDAER